MAAEIDAADRAARERAQDFLGTVVADRYRVDSIVAMGGFGAVLSGEHVHLRKRVAIKILHPDSQNLPELVTRFERESVVGAHATHPNVASATDFGQLDDGTYYLVLEYIDGITLHALMRRGPIPIDRVVDITRQVALALEAIHKLDIFHRDLKPRNIMIVEGPPDVVKLIDFGFAKVPLERFAKSVEEAMKITTKGTIFGTIGYIAPEAAHGMHAVTHRSDLYALGVILYEMLTGLHPFDEKDSVKLFYEHQVKQPPSFQERAPDRTIPKALETITMRLLSKSPKDRYDSAKDLVDALDAALKDPKPKSSSSTRRSKQTLQPDKPLFSQVADQPSATRPLIWLSLVAIAALGGVLAFVPSVRMRLLDAISSPQTPPTIATEAVASPPSASSLVKPAVLTDAAEPEASATVVPTASVAPSAAIMDGLNPAQWRGVLRESAAVQDGGRGAKAIVALAYIDPDAFTEMDVIIAAATIAVAVELGDRTTADRVFDILASDRIGSGGPDVLFQITSTSGGSRGAKRAAELLAKPEILQRASPAMRIAMALRDAPCKEKPALFDRAGREGDERTLGLLMKMAAHDCDSQTGLCCMQYDPNINTTIAQIRGRIKTRPSPDRPLDQPSSSPPEVKTPAPEPEIKTPATAPEPQQPAPEPQEPASDVKDPY